MKILKFQISFSVGIGHRLVGVHVLVRAHALVTSTMKIFLIFFCTITFVMKFQVSFTVEIDHILVGVNVLVRAHAGTITFNLSLKDL